MCPNNNCNDSYYPLPPSLPNNLFIQSCDDKCSATPVCKTKISAKCVIYEGPLLSGLGLGTNIDVETVLYAISELLKRCNPCGTSPCSCDRPADFNVTCNTTGLSSGQYRIVITWSTVSAATGFVIEYKLSSANSWTILTSNAQGTSNSSLVVSLGSNTNLVYDFRIKSNCGQCESIYNYFNNFSINISCPQVTAFSVS